MQQISSIPKKEATVACNVARNAPFPPKGGMVKAKKHAQDCFIFTSRRLNVKNKVHSTVFSTLGQRGSS